MNPVDIIARLAEGHTNPPTDDEVAKAMTDLRDALDAATSGDKPDLTAAKEIRAGIDLLVKEVGKREEIAKAEREEAAKLREGILDADETPEEPEDKPDEDEAPEDAEDKVAEPVAASGDFQSVIDSLRKRTAASSKKDEIVSKPSAYLTPVGPASSYSLDPQAGFRELGGLFHKHGRAGHKGAQIPLVTLTREFTEDRQLGENVQQNAQRIADALGVGTMTRKPIAASGGLCGPGDVDHTHPVCSQTGRVVTSALPQFNASRGQVTVPPSMSLADVAGAVSIWTAETDANPGQSTKPCPPLDCPTELTEQVDAVVRCLTIGNFQAKFSPEFWAAALETLMALHDREAEQKALEEIYAASSTVGTVNEGSTVWNFLQLINNVISGDRSARRNWDGGYTAIADAYLRDQIRNQLIANLGSGADPTQSIQVANATIDGWVRDAGITNMVWTYDGTYNGTSHRVISAHTQSGHLPPTDAGVLIFPEEAFLFLDGGTLDLGTEITDSTLNATNDRQAFAETFEKVLFRGCGSFRGVVTIDASCGCGLTSI
jgi:hypothetical protein